MHLVWGNILWDAGVALSKYFFWHRQMEEDAFRSRRVLELGAGTGVVGLTLGKLGASVTMTDCEPEVLDLLHRNSLANGIAGSTEVRELNWSDRSSFLQPAVPFDMIVAADVLYSKKDRWFMSALEAHMSQGVETIAYVACPPRKDSPLGGFFEAAHGTGFLLERLEDSGGAAVASTTGNAASVYGGSCFNHLRQERFAAATRDAKTDIQIFRLRWGQPERGKAS